MERGLEGPEPSALRMVRPRPASLRRTRGAVGGGLALAWPEPQAPGQESGQGLSKVTSDCTGWEERSGAPVVGQGARRLAESSWGVG